MTPLPPPPEEMVIVTGVRRHSPDLDDRFDESPKEQPPVTTPVAIPKPPVQFEDDVQPYVPPPPLLSPDDEIRITSTPNAKSSTTITINNDSVLLADPSNSLATNVSQVTVVTSHPPVIIDNSLAIVAGRSGSSSSASSTKSFGSSQRRSRVLTPKNSDEVVIVSNELNKTHVNESSTDDDFQSLDSLENLSPRHRKRQQQQQQLSGSSGQIARKLDESEVLIVSSGYIGDDDREREQIASEQDDFINDELFIGESNCTKCDFFPNSIAS